MRACWMLLFAACGRIGFDAMPDALPCSPSGHDEDLDGVDDACDTCPHLADLDQTDTDGDRVGDICDPRATPTERIAFFDPFVTRRPEWVFRPEARASIRNGQLVLDAISGGVRSSVQIAPTTDVFAFAAHIIRVGAVPRQLALAASQGTAFDITAPVYYCDLYEDQTPRFQITTTLDNMNFAQLAGTSANPLTGGDFTLSLEHQPPVVRCVTTFPATLQVLEGALPTNITARSIGFRAGEIEVALDYFIQIHTD